MTSWRSLLLAAGLTLILAGRASADPTPDTWHIAVIYTDELLLNEERALADLEKELAKLPKGKKRTVTRAAATAEEKAVAAAYLAARPPAAAPPLPAAWGALETVMVVEVFPAKGKKPDRRSGGMGSLIIFRPPSAEPAIVYAVNNLSGLQLSKEWAKELVSWLGKSATVVSR